MSSKLIIIIFVILIQAVFAGLNIKNVSDISLGFAKFHDIPVFLTITVSFIVGALITFPVAFIAGRSKKKTAEIIKESKKSKKNSISINDNNKKDNIQ